jgi:hypothetical protein
MILIYYHLDILLFTFMTKGRLKKYRVKKLLYLCPVLKKNLINEKENFNIIDCADRF